MIIIYFLIKYFFGQENGTNLFFYLKREVRYKSLPYSSKTYKAKGLIVERFSQNIINNL